MQQLLMIEDDVRLAGMVADYLGQNGFAVAHAPDAHSGLARLQTPGVDLVILDLMLPDMDGLQVCQRIRALPGNGHCFVMARSEATRPSMFRLPNFTVWMSRDPEPGWMISP